MDRPPGRPPARRRWRVELTWRLTADEFDEFDQFLRDVDELKGWRPGDEGDGPEQPA